MKWFRLPVALGYLFMLCGFSQAKSIEAPPQPTLVIVDVVDWLHPQQQKMHQATVLKLLLDNLPLAHETVQITRNRARQFVAEHPSACMPWLIKTPERMQMFLFSTPYMAEHALQLITLRGTALSERLERQSATAPIQLQQLLTERRPPVLGIETNRSYGKKTDRLLATLQRSSSIYTRTSSSNQPADLLPMLQRGFIDIMIDYEVVLHEHRQELSFFPFAETEAFQLSHFACSNSAAMRSILPILNQTIHALSTDPAFQQLSVQSIPPHQQAEAWQYLKAAQQNP